MDDIKKLNEIPKKNDRVKITINIKTLLNINPENGMASKRPRLNGMMDMRI
jgi:hypothetical protein